jgi:hypothetical protein
MSKTQQILAIIQETSTELRAFERRGPGAGDLATNQVMARINKQVAIEFGREVIERAFTAGVRQSVDFYVPDEATVIEVEFSLCNPYPCLEKDAFKILLAKEAGYTIKTLVLVGDPGCTKRLSSPAPRAIISWLKKNHDLEICVVELKGS